MVDIGMPTLIELPEIEDCAALCSKLGLQFVELNMNLPQYQTVSLDADRLEAAANRYGIYFTIHLDENLNVSDFNPFVAQAYTRTVLETIRVARRLNTQCLICICPKACILRFPTGKYFYTSNTGSNIYRASGFSGKPARIISERPTLKSALKTAAATRIFSFWRWICCWKAPYSR